MRSLSEIATAELNFTKNPFWIQVQNLLLELLNSKNVSTLLKKVGRVLEIEDPIVDGKIFRNFIRARVMLDVTKPLPAVC